MKSIIGEYISNNLDQFMIIVIILIVEIEDYLK